MRSARPPAPAASRARGAVDHLPTADLGTRRLARIASGRTARSIVIDLAGGAADAPTQAGRAVRAAVERVAAPVGVTAARVAEIGTGLRRASDANVVRADAPLGTRFARLLDAAAQVDRSAPGHESGILRLGARGRRAARRLVTDFGARAVAAAHRRAASVVHAAAFRAAARRGRALRAHVPDALRRAAARSAGDASATASVGHRAAERAAFGVGALWRSAAANAAQAALAAGAGAALGLAASVRDRSAEVRLRIGSARRGGAPPVALTCVARSGGHARVVDAVLASVAAPAADGDPARVDGHDAALAGARLRLARLRRRIAGVGRANIAAIARRPAREYLPRTRILVPTALEACGAARDGRARIYRSRHRRAQTGVVGGYGHRGGPVARRARRVGRTIAACARPVGIAPTSRDRERRREHPDGESDPAPFRTRHKYSMYLADESRATTRARNSGCLDTAAHAATFALSHIPFSIAGRSGPSGAFPRNHQIAERCPSTCSGTPPPRIHPRVGRKPSRRVCRRSRRRGVGLVRILRTHGSFCRGWPARNRRSLARPSALSCTETTSPLPVPAHQLARTDFTLARSVSRIWIDRPNPSSAPMALSRASAAEAPCDALCAAPSAG